ncbi:MAG: four helix bundle protein [Deltaproteobacteria bacterium]|nr:four helix bundle protein [Deltaproteobacteria bacterium]
MRTDKAEGGRQRAEDGGRRTDKAEDRGQRTEDRGWIKHQIRRPSRAFGANLAETWQKRRYEAHFMSKLSDSDAEQAETQHWLDTALNCKYIQPEVHRASLKNAWKSAACSAP